MIMCEHPKELFPINLVFDGRFLYDDEVANFFRNATKLLSIFIRIIDHIVQKLP